MSHIYSINRFKTSFGDLYRKYVVIADKSLIETDYYVLTLDGQQIPAISNGSDPIYALAWIAPNLSAQSKSALIASSVLSFRASTYYDVVALSPVVYLYNPERNYIVRDKCDVPEIQPFYSGDLDAFDKFIQGINATDKKSAMEAPKSACDCGSFKTYGTPDDSPVHSSWCKTRWFYGRR